MSNRKRKLLNLVYKMLNELYGEDVTIKRDPLHRRYEVNRYSIEVISESNRNLEGMRKTLRENIHGKIWPEVACSVMTDTVKIGYPEGNVFINIDISTQFNLLRVIIV